MKFASILIAMLVAITTLVPAEQLKKTNFNQSPRDQQGGELTQTETRIQELENQVTQLSKKSWYNGFHFGIDLLSIAISAVLVFLIIWLVNPNFFATTSYARKKAPAFNKDWVMGKISEASVNGNVMDSQSKVLELERKIQELEKKFKKATTAAPLRKPEPQVTAQQEPPAVQEEIKKPEFFFLSTPNTDGSFNESSASSAYKEGASIYRFTRLSHSLARFQVDDRDASMKLALHYPDKNIDPVCEALNGYNPKATRINTEAPGEAELIGDKWVRVAKAKITYES